MTEQNLKILLTGWGYPPEIDGGLDIHVYHLFNELRKEQGLEVNLVLPEENAPDREGIIPVSTGEGDMTWKARKMSAEIAKIAGEYDIIHTHDWFGAEAGFKASKYSDTKWVSTMHSLVSSRTRGTSEKIEKMEKVAIEEPGRLIAVSEGLKEDIEREYGAEASVIHNGFSKPDSTGEDVREMLDIDENMVFFVGRHAEQKGIEHLLYGFQKFLENGNEATLVIGGDGHMRESLEEFTDIMDIRDKVIFTGFIPSEELGDYYSAADAFVSPSINEPFGLTITEALESGTPVLATESGVNELVSTAAITEIDPESDSIAEGLEEALRKDFSPEYESRSWKDMAEEVVKTYRDIS
ncbi:MAG: glycosyltransferase family 4 protein [Candidatus Nanohalobium sp.]